MRHDAISSENLDFEVVLLHFEVLDCAQVNEEDCRVKEALVFVSSFPTCNHRSALLLTEWVFDETF